MCRFMNVNFFHHHLVFTVFIRRSNQELKEHCTTNGLHIDPFTINLDRPSVKFQVPVSIANRNTEAEDPTDIDDVDPVASVSEEVVGGTKPKYCCVVGCSNNTRRDVKFFNIPCRNLEQRKLWLQAINRMDEDGNPWMPRKWSKICSSHFIGGKPSPTRKDFISHGLLVEVKTGLRSQRIALCNIESNVTLDVISVTEGLTDEPLTERIQLTILLS